MLGFQNLPKHPKLQSASIGSRCSSSKGFFLSGFHLWFLAFCTNMPEEFVVRFPLAPRGFVRLCCMIRVLWFSFFFKLTLLICFKKKIKEFQIFFPSVPSSAKVMPWSLWKWMWPQCIFEGKHFPNSIGFSPGKAQVTNIDLKCSFFTGLQKVKAGSQFFSNCAWGFHEDGYWNQPW